MLWAIDAGNTQVAVGLYDGEWKSVYRLSTPGIGTEDEVAATLSQLCELAGLPFKADKLAIASVAPQVNDSFIRLAREWFEIEPHVLSSGSDFAVSVDYEPAAAVGADRLANALAVIRLHQPPAIVIDFGTATTFDVISPDGVYLGGAILPGPDTLMDSLTSKTAKLPRVPIEVPATPIGKNTPHALQSGVVLGYIGAIEALITSIKSELGVPADVIATGGLGELMFEMCPQIESFEPMLTLDGIRLASGY